MPSFRESVFLAVVKSLYALIAAGLDVVRIAFSKSKIKETAAAVVVGIGLLVGSTADVQAACDPPVYDVCFHKGDGSSFSIDGHVKLEIEFDVPSSKQNQQYEVVWHGLKGFFDPLTYRTWYSYDDVSHTGIYGNRTISYSRFWWDSLAPYGYNNYGCSIYEWDSSTGRGDWVAQVDFYSHQAAAYVSIDNRSSALDFEWNTYYCTIDWDPVPVPLFSGYTRRQCVNYRGYWYRFGDVGSPRFAYRSRCSHTITPTPCP